MVNASQVEIRVVGDKLSAIKSQDTIYEMWRRCSNLAWSTLNTIAVQLYGINYIDPFQTLNCADNLTLSNTVRLLITSIEEAIDCINFLLWCEHGGAIVVPVDYDAFDLFSNIRSNTTDSANLVDSPSDITAKIVTDIVNNPWIYFANEDPDRDLIRIAEVHIWDLPSDTDIYDVFISYKQTKYRHDVDIISSRLRELGITVWVDRERLMLPGRVRRYDLAQQLICAIRNSKTMIFFETYADAIADETRRGLKTVFNWQQFEHKHGSTLLIVRPRSHEVTDSSGRTVINYTSLTDLSAKIAAFIKNRSPYISNTITAPQDDDLSLCCDIIQAQLNERFCHSMPISLQALLSLCSSRADTYSRPVLGDDILIGLIRQSPRSALALNAAGVKPENLLMMGPDISPRRWEVPGTFRLRDAIGNDGAFPSPESEFFDESVLLAGILAFAANGSNAADLLWRAWNASVGSVGSGNLRKGDDEVRRIRDEVLNYQTSNGTLVTSDQQWELWWEGRWRVRPCASCGVWDIHTRSGPHDEKTDEGDQAGGLYNVVISQTDLLYKPTELVLLEQHINQASLEGLKAFLGSHQEYQLSFSRGEANCCRTIDLTNDLPGIGRITLHPMEIRPSSVIPADAEAVDWIFDAINKNKSALMESRRRLHISPLMDCYTKQALVIGAAPRPAHPRATHQRVHLRDIVLRILPQLSAYFQFRDTDPEFIEPFGSNS